MNSVELLAPAGDLERLKFAYLYGADAVYIGGKNFSLRANAKNFSIDEIKEAVNIAHNLGKKLYVTVNIVFHNDDLKGLKEYLEELSNIKVDAIIVSDIVVMDIINKNNIDLEVHLSTQASTLNASSAKFYLQQGVKRLVLAREASKEDIINIKKETHADIEVFAHGAMCSSFSGKCVLSNCFTNRDSNRGGCAQICRWCFNIDDADETFSITPKDLNMVKYIKDMIDIGVNSFKIEGRMRSIYYISTVINTYRQIIDKILNNTLTDAYINYYQDILNRCANRESTAQFYDKLPTNKEQYFLGRKEESNQDFIGIVKSYDKNTKTATFEQRNYLKQGDIVEIFGPGIEPSTIKIEEMYDENDQKITIANHPQMIVKIKCNLELKPNDIIRKKIFDISSYL